MRACLTLIFITVIIIYAYRTGYNQGSNPVVASNEPSSSTNEATLTDVAEVADEPAPTEGEATVVHVVQDGETLFLIGLKYDVLWTTIAAANNITENTPLTTGLKLIIPLNKDGSVTKTETLNISDDDSKKTQTAVDHGEQSWRKDILEVVRRTLPVDYHLINEDPLSVTAQDLTAGTATVEVQHNSQKFIVELIQPQTKGDGGVWYIAKINSQ